MILSVECAKNSKWSQVHKYLYKSYQTCLSHLCKVFPCPVSNLKYLKIVDLDCFIT